MRSFAIEMRKIVSSGRLIAILLYLPILYMLVTVFSSMVHDEGKFIYALDDAYIHMSMAKNFAGNAVWGITPDYFSGSSSSPLYTLFLGLPAFLWGPHDLTPFFFNLAMLLLLFLYLHFYLKEILPSAVFIAMVNGLIFFLTPLYLLPALGMENGLQVLINVTFVTGATAFITKRDEPSPFRFQVICLLGALVVSVRYEGFLLIVVLATVMALAVSLRSALLFLISSMAPLCLYALFSLFFGGYVVPNSLIIQTSSLWSRIAPVRHVHLLIPILFLLLFVAALLYLKRERRVGRFLVAHIELLFLLSVNATQMIFPIEGAFWRYRLYLVPVSIVLSILILNKYQGVISRVISVRKVGAILFLSLLFLSFWRIPFYVEKITTASRNIYEQQYQMAQFVKEHYHGATIALNDIGAVSYYGGVRIVDIWGLASQEITGLRMRGEYRANTIEAITAREKVDIAILYENIFSEHGGLPPDWTKVARWEIASNLICGSSRVYFYAPHKDVAPALRDRVVEYAEDKLPVSVTYQLLPEVK